MMDYKETRGILKPYALDENHKWDRDGERCIKCGDKDWYADAKCSNALLKDKDLTNDR